jgi:chromosomal replication initiation ATPase DnaA
MAKRMQALGWSNLEKALSLDPSAPELIVLGSRPSIGKTCFALNLGVRLAERENSSIAFLTLESTKEEVARKVIKQFGEDQAAKVLNLSFVIEDKTYKSFDDVIEVMQSMGQKNTFGLFIIDYLQLIPANVIEDYDTQLLNIVMQLKKLIKETKAHIFIVSQLSRGVECRQEKRPLITDLGECSVLLDHADKLLLLYRDDYYNPDSHYPNQMELNIAKNRTGATETIYFNWLPETISFEEIASTEKEQIYPELSRCQKQLPLIVRDHNREAYVTLSLLVEKPTTGNGYYVHSHSKSGKTHLLKDVSYRIQLQHPELRIYFTTAESFVKDVELSVERSSLDEMFKELSGYDLFIFDDFDKLQFFDVSFQFVLCLISSLHESQKTIILSGEILPKDFYTDFDVSGLLSSFYYLEIHKLQKYDKSKILSDFLNENTSDDDGKSIDIFDSLTIGQLRDLVRAFGTCLPKS